MIINASRTQTLATHQPAPTPQPVLRFPRTVRWVKQEDEHGCGVAALAMILGQTYGFVRLFFPAIALRGVPTSDCAPFLRVFGYDVEWHTEDGSALWPPAPSARAHLCLVQPSALLPNRHWVVMLQSGTVLDPDHVCPKYLFMYARVLRVGTIIDPA